MDGPAVVGKCKCGRGWRAMMVNDVVLFAGYGRAVDPRRALSEQCCCGGQGMQLQRT